METVSFNLLKFYHKAALLQMHRQRQPVSPHPLCPAEHSPLLTSIMNYKPVLPCAGPSAHGGSPGAEPRGEQRPGRGTRPGCSCPAAPGAALLQAQPLLRDAAGRGGSTDSWGTSHLRERHCSLQGRDVLWVFPEPRGHIPVVSQS